MSTLAGPAIHVGRFPQSLAAHRRIIAAAGILFAALSFLGIATIGALPKGGDPPANFVAYISDHRGAILTTNVLLSLANGALLVFFAHLRSVLASDGRPDTLPALAFGAALLLCALGAAASMLPAGLAFYGTAGIDPALIRLFFNFYFTTNAFSALAAALAVGTVAVSVLSTGALPRWLGAVSMVVAAAQFAAQFTLLGGGPFFAPDGGYGAGVLFGSLTVWVLVVSITLVLGGRHRGNTT